MFECVILMKQIDGNNRMRSTVRFDFDDLIIPLAICLNDVDIIYILLL